MTAAAIPYSLYRRICRPEPEPPSALVLAIAPYTVTGHVDRVALEDADVRTALADRLDR